MRKPHTRHEQRIHNLEGYQVKNFRAKLGAAIRYQEPPLPCFTEKQLQDAFMATGVLPPRMLQRELKESIQWLDPNVWIPIPDAFKIESFSDERFDSCFRVEVIEVVNQHDVSNLRLVQWANVHHWLYDEGGFLDLLVIDISNKHGGETRRLYSWEEFESLEFYNDATDFIQSEMHFNEWQCLKAAEYDRQFAIAFFAKSLGVFSNA